ncbi:EpsG family protein [Pseudoalteromonas carrageenovora]|uniref:EpsG family protein n=1 Tax=Pseudoalteromonas carrageenovora TaxID=227 RepID=UPI0026E1A3F6|nr:EpsG family protein [Pseudoalteromonas carrageenovora]MDO6635779.1 EpsG family protein [Pseudoalteromonas carrageenovora]MDO6647772.1 EpsG family protein [Pseudoalteromonas carrageenovora]
MIFKDNKITFSVVAIAFFFTAYFSIFMSIALLACFLPFLASTNVNFLAAFFLIFFMAFLQSDFIPISDSKQYLDYFKTIYFNVGADDSRAQSKALEVAWVAYIYILSFIASPEYFFFFNTLFLYMFAMFISKKLASEYYIIVFLLFVFLGFSNNLNFLIRQYYASIFVLFYFVFLDKRALIRGGICFLALGFHLSTVIYFPLLSKKFVNVINSRAIFFLGTSLFFSFFITLDNIILVYQNFNEVLLVDRLRYYNNVSSVSTIFSPYFLEKLLFLVLVLKVDTGLLTKREFHLRALLIYSFSLYLLFSNVAILSERVGIFSALFLGLFLFIPIKYYNKISIFNVSFNPIVILYFYLPFRILFWGISNENTHVINYFDGNILSIGLRSIPL